MRIPPSEDVPQSMASLIKQTHTCSIHVAFADVLYVSRAACIHLHSSSTLSAHTTVPIRSQANRLNTVQTSEGNALRQQEIPSATMGKHLGYAVSVFVAVPPRRAC